MYDRDNPAHVTTLRNELAADPRGYGYAPLLTTGDDGGLANLLNFIRDGTTLAPNGIAGAAATVREPDVASKAIWEAIDIVDFPALPSNPNATALSTERRSLSWLEGLSNIPRVRLLNDDGTDTPVVANLKGMFPAGTPTRNRLLALAARNGTRAEELFGAGASLQPDDISGAR